MMSSDIHLVFTLLSAALDRFVVSHMQNRLPADFCSAVAAKRLSESVVNRHVVYTRTFPVLDPLPSAFIELGFIADRLAIMSSRSSLSHYVVRQIFIIIPCSFYVSVIVIIPRIIEFKTRTSSKLRSL